MRNIEVKYHCVDLGSVRRAAEVVGARDAGIPVQMTPSSGRPGDG